MRILVMQRISAELLGVWIYLVLVMSEALEAIIAIISVKLAVSEYSSRCINRVCDRSFRDDFGFESCRLDDFLN